MAMAMAKNDPFKGARKYAGKNSGPNVVTNAEQVYGVTVVRPYIKPPNTRTFDQLGWNGRKTSQD